MARRELIEENPSIFSQAKALLSGQAGTVAWNVALFAAGVAFIKSSLMDNLAPQ
jgi:hypothetical protein